MLAARNCGFRTASGSQHGTAAANGNTILFTYFSNGHAASRPSLLLLSQRLKRNTVCGRKNVCNELCNAAAGHVTAVACVGNIDLLVEYSVLIKSLAQIGRR